MKETVRYWLAGLYEGEGSFIKGPPSNPHTPRVSLQMTDEDVMEKAASLLGTTYSKCKRRKPKHHKESFIVMLRGQNAVDFMRQIYPLMSKRRKQQMQKAIACHVPKKSIKWPSDKKLLRMRKTMSYRQIGKLFGCSHSTVMRKFQTLME